MRAASLLAMAIALFGCNCDGERMPPGFSLEQIPPDQIERIEIQRAPTAETGARAIAGSINIVLREPLARKLNEFRVQLGGDHGEPQANATWTRNDSWGETLNYSLTLGLNRRRDADETYSRTERSMNGLPIESRSSSSHTCTFAAWPSASASRRAARASPRSRRRSSRRAHRSSASRRASSGSSGASATASRSSRSVRRATSARSPCSRPSP